MRAAPAGLKPFHEIPGPKPTGLSGLLYGNALQQAAPTKSLYPKVHVNWHLWARKYGQQGMYRCATLQLD